MIRLAPVLVALATFCASACGSNKESRPSGEPPPTPHETPSPRVAPAVTDAAGPAVEPMALCEEAMRFLHHAIDCAPTDLRAALASNATNLEMIVHGITADTPQNGRESAGALCAISAYSFDRELATHTDKKCAVALTSAERLRVRDYLAAYYARRTSPRPTGDRSLDDQLSALAAARDTMCACTEIKCVDGTQKIVDAAVKPVPRDMQAAMDDAEAIVDEVTRCSGRVEAGIPLALP